MKYFLILILFLAATVNAAEVYRTIDKNGNVIFSDVEEDNSEEVVIDIAPSYAAPAVPALVLEDNKTDEKKGVEVDLPKYQISISSPAQNETFQNPESITVTAVVIPELNGSRADKLLFKLDGKPIGEAQEEASITITELERGSHILVVAVVDKSGKVMKKSKSTLFHVHRASVAN
ncbi:MAG: DUF4124 domain-containing protein [Methylophaga sp.]|nr:DUF4124 domain-containing protein [Methylophaga sp.]